jgi:hypothetical protein
VPWGARRHGVMSVTTRSMRTNATCAAHNIAIQRDQVSALFARWRTTRNRSG